MRWRTTHISLHKQQHNHVRDPSVFSPRVPRKPPATHTNTANNKTCHVSLLCHTMCVGLTIPYAKPNLECFFTNNSLLLLSFKNQKLITPIGLSETVSPNHTHHSSLLSCRVTQHAASITNHNPQAFYFTFINHAHSCHYMTYHTALHIDPNKPGLSLDSFGSHPHYSPLPLSSGEHTYRTNSKSKTWHT